VGEIFRKGLTQWVINVGPHILHKQNTLISLLKYLKCKLIIFIFILKLEKNVKDSTAILALGSAHYDPIVNAYRLSQVLTAITTFSKEEDKHRVESSLVELIVLAHHPSIGWFYFADCNIFHLEFKYFYLII